MLLRGVEKKSYIKSIVSLSNIRSDTIVKCLVYHFTHGWSVEHLSVFFEVPEQNVIRAIKVLNCVERSVDLYRDTKNPEHLIGLTRIRSKEIINLLKHYIVKGSCDNLIMGEITISNFNRSIRRFNSVKNNVEAAING